MKWILTIALAGCAVGQTFEVATIKPTPNDARNGRVMRMTGPRQFSAVNYTPRVLIAAAFELNPQAVVGGPAWIDTESFDIAAVTPGDTRPNPSQQLSMLRALLAERYALAYHREERTMPVYMLSTAPSGHKLKPTVATPESDPDIVNVVYPGRIELPARNATMAQVAAVLQRSVFDRPILDQTGLGVQRFDFDLVWAPDETQFGGRLPAAAPDPNLPSFFTAVQEQLGLKFEAARGPVMALVIDRIERPSEN